MTQAVIQVDRLSKMYRLGVIGASSVRDRLEHWWSGRRGGTQGESDSKEFWALRDVSFAVEPGEVVGIVGRNGAGKSTALKLLARITEPTSGRAVLRGRVASLLEVGTGFHPDLTGRDNIYMNGAILGMKIAEINARFDDIVDFAEISQFLDTPVKRYSSGMYVRLAFAVAAHLDPEILLIDEVLAVGDASFQKKCLGKLGDVAREGRTVLFVSHNMTAVQSLCTRALWLEGGALRYDGRVASVISDYLRGQLDHGIERVWTEENAPGDESVHLLRARLVIDGSDEIAVATISSEITLQFDYHVTAPEAILNLSMILYNEEGVVVLSSPSTVDDEWKDRPMTAGMYHSECRIPGSLLNDGLYRVALLLVKDWSRVLTVVEDALVFEVRDNADGRNGWFGKWIGAVRPSLVWHTHQLDSVSTANDA